MTDALAGLGGPGKCEPRLTDGGCLRRSARALVVFPSRGTTYFGQTKAWEKFIIAKYMQK